MKKFENSLDVFTQLRIMFNNGELVPTSYMSPDYKILYYDCACGQKHLLASTQYVLCAKGPIRFFFICENSICTLVSVKGFFKQASAVEWFVDSSTFLDAFARFVSSDERCSVFHNSALDNVDLGNDVELGNDIVTPENFGEKVRLDKYLYLFNYSEHYESVLKDATNRDKMICELYLFRAWTTQLGFRLFSNNPDVSDAIIGETVNLSKFGAGMLAQTEKVDIESIYSQKYIDIMSARWEHYDDIFLAKKDTNFAAQALANTVQELSDSKSINNTLVLPVHYLSHLEEIKQEAVSVGLLAG